MATLPDRKKPRFAVLGGLAVGVLVLLVVSWNLLTPRQADAVRITAKHGIRGQEMPRQVGSVRFVGTVYVKGVAAAHKSFVFLFHDGFVSRTIGTTSTGAFEYTLPPGHWTLVAPYVPDLAGNIRFEMEPPVQRRKLSFEVAEGPVTQTYTIAVHAE
jgi:hypothetical protein